MMATKSTNNNIHYQPMGQWAYVNQRLFFNISNDTESLYHIYETPSQHAAGIEQETQASLQNFINKNGRSRVNNWIDDTIDAHDKHKRVDIILKKIAWRTGIQPHTPRLSDKASEIQADDKLMRKQFTRPPRFPAGFHAADPNETPFAGPRLIAPPSPNALPIPSFYKRKASQISTTTPSTNTFIINDEDNFAIMPPSPHLAPTLIPSGDDSDLSELSLTPSITSSSDGWSLIEEPLTPITVSDSPETLIESSTPSASIIDEMEQHQLLPTPPASPVDHDCSEQRAQLSQLEALLFILAIDYIRSYSLDTNNGQLTALLNTLDSWNIDPANNRDFTNKMIVLVLAVATDYMDAAEADPITADIREREVLKQIHYTKMRINKLRQYIEE